MYRLHSKLCAPKLTLGCAAVAALSLLALGASAIPAQAAPSIPGFGAGGAGLDITTQGLSGYTSAGINCVVSTAGLSQVCGPTYVGFQGQTPALWTAPPSAAPVGGNFAALNANATYAGALGTTISGLSVGANYVLSFYQSADSQALSGGGAFSEYLAVTIDGAAAVSTPTMANDGLTQTLPWELVQIPFTATAASESLSFLAVAPLGTPPFALLSAPSVSLAVPEPSTLAVFVSCVSAILGLRRRLGRPGTTSSGNIPVG